MVIRLGSLVYRDTEVTVQQVDEPISPWAHLEGLGIALALVAFVVTLAVIVGMHRGLVWGIATGFFSWGLIFALVLCCACRACGENDGG